MNSALVMLVTLALVTSQDEADAGRKKARETILAHLTHRARLAKLQGAKDWEFISDNDWKRLSAAQHQHLPGVLVELVDVQGESLGKSFKRCKFFVLLFRKYPVEAPPPKPYKVLSQRRKKKDAVWANNLFVVTGGRMDVISDETGLEEFFKKYLQPTDDRKALADATTRSWLRLVQELHHDGYYKFLEPTVEASETASEGHLPVDEKTSMRDTGELTVKMEFADGQLKSVKPGGELTAGTRPKCQATRLLDEDPEIREIMRRDILVMGSACKLYLDEVRAEAIPELQRAIDIIWQQILDEER